MLVLNLKTCYSRKNQAAEMTESCRKHNVGNIDRGKDVTFLKLPGKHDLKSKQMNFKNFDKRIGKLNTCKTLTFENINVSCDCFVNFPLNS